MRLKKWFYIFVMAALLVAALIYAFQPAALPVDTAVVFKGPLQIEITEEGRTRVIDRYTVSTPVTGYLRRIQMKTGAKVEKGEAIATLEPLRSSALDPRSRAEAQARLAAARAANQASRQNVNVARAEANYADASLKRLMSLFESGNVSKESFDEARARAESSRAALRSAEFADEVTLHEVEAAQTALQFFAADTTQQSNDTINVHSPLAGNVLKLFRESEGSVTQGEAIMEIGDPGRIEVVVEVLSGDAVHILPDTPVIIEGWGGSEQVAGVVERIEPVGFTKVSALGVEEQRVTVVVKVNATAALWRRMGHGYRVDARFVLWQQDDVLQIPNSAVFTPDDYSDTSSSIKKNKVQDQSDNGGVQNRAVFVVADNTAVLRRIQTGKQGGFMTQVIAGVDAGERVIVHPDRSLNDGAGVKIR